MIDIGAQISHILARFFASTRLFDAEGAILSAPQFRVHPFTGTLMVIPILMVHVRLNR